jgi:hypothetical protein
MSTSSLAHLADLPESTRKVLELLASAAESARYMLAGGTGLALQAGHRVSEDIDLVWTETSKDRSARQPQNSDHAHSSAVLQG